MPGGIIEDSCVLKGVMVNKDVTHPRMRRLIKNPRIVLLDCSLEYKKGESQVRCCLNPQSLNAYLKMYKTLTVGLSLPSD